MSEIESVHLVYLRDPADLVCMYVLIAVVLACSMPGDSFLGLEGASSLFLIISVCREAFQPEFGAYRALARVVILP